MVLEVEGGILVLAVEDSASGLYCGRGCARLRLGSAMVGSVDVGGGGKAVLVSADALWVSSEGGLSWLVRGCAGIGASYSGRCGADGSSSSSMATVL